MRAAQQQLRAAFEHASTGMALLDDRGRFVEVNGALAAFLELPAEEVVGASIDKHVCLDGVDSVASTVADVAAGRCRGLRAEVELIGAARVGLGFDTRFGLLAASRVPGSSGGSQVLLQLDDITERRAFDRRLVHQTGHDLLTGLPNRHLLLDRLRLDLTAGRRPALLLVDLDRFKQVNDALGQAAGDQLLCLVGDRLVGCLRPGDLVARLGGDEFVLVCAGADAAGAAVIAERVADALRPPFLLDGAERHRTHVTASVGIALPGRGSTPESVLGEADFAMHETKREHGGPRLFRAEPRDQARDRLRMAEALRAAVARDEVTVSYQPIVDLGTGRPNGFEALARWTLPDGRPVSPSVFVPLAEETDLVVDLDLQVLRMALRDTAGWVGADGSPILRCVNVVPVELASPRFLARLVDALWIAEVDPATVCLEVTETGLAGDVRQLAATLGRLRDLGVRLAIDDFGAGHTSLAYLARLPVHAVKLDQSFVAAAASDHRSRAIVEAVVRMADAYELAVVAEGVETAAQLDVVRRAGCSSAQGYLFGAPAPPAEACRTLTTTDLRVAG